MNDPQDKKLVQRKKAPALGRGLAALLGDDHLMAGQPTTDPRSGDQVISLSLERLESNLFQPRLVYEQTSLQTLADSIAQYGVIQPLVVRPIDGGYQLIAGERRLRASQMAGLGEVPVVVRQATDEQALLLALLENLQREDLNPLEEARAFQRLSEEFALSQDDIAVGVGKDRSTVANILRLLKLPQLIQNDLETGRLSAGHGRAILALDRDHLMRKARDLVLKKGLSVRATERLVKDMLRQPKPAKAPSQTAAYVASLAEEIQRKVGAKVEIKRQGKKGQIVLHFFSDYELERLLDLLH
jgi:ParB family chromosome partitioning protein